MYTGLHIKYPSFLSDFNKTWIFWADFGKIIKYKISWKSVRGSRVVPCGRTNRQTFMTKLIVAFRQVWKTGVKNVPLQFYVGCCTSLYRSFATKASQPKILHFWVIGIERNVCRCTFNRYSVITQFVNSPGDNNCVAVHP